MLMPAWSWKLKVGSSRYLQVSALTSQNHRKNECASSAENYCEDSGWYRTEQWRSACLMQVATYFSILSTEKIFQGHIPIFFAVTADEQIACK